MDLSAAEAWLQGLIDVERMPDRRQARFSLTPIRALLARLGDPQRGLAALHVAGSKGKGSVALLSEALLRAGGLRTGVFTSPHLERWTERFRIDGREVAGSRLAAAVERIRPEVEALRAEDPALTPTFFDACTAAALLIFAEAGVDRAVLEVGLGGRSDSTNVCEPVVTCVTSIELEHAEILGRSLEAIAAEKAGILKPGVPAVMGGLPPEARAVVEARAAEVGAPLFRQGADFGVEAVDAGPDGMALRLWDGAFRGEARLAVLGAHQAHNAAMAMACVRRAGMSDPQLAPVLARAFADVSLPGRVEMLGRRPWLLVDAAHTPESAHALTAAIRGLPHRRVHLVLSISRGKELAELCAILCPIAAAVTITRAEPRRSLAPDEVAAAVRAAAPTARVRVVPNPHLALRAAREALGAEDLLCAAGSVYLAGIARRVLAGDARSPVVVSRRAPAPARPDGR